MRTGIIVTTVVGGTAAVLLARWALRRTATSSVTRASIEDEDQIEDGDDLIECVNTSRGRGLGLAQRTP